MIGIIDGQSGRDLRCGEPVAVHEPEQLALAVVFEDGCDVGVVWCHVAVLIVGALAVVGPISLQREKGGG